MPKRWRMPSIRWQKPHETKIERPLCGSRRFHREQLHGWLEQHFAAVLRLIRRIEAPTALPLRRLLFWALGRYRLEKRQAELQDDVSSVLFLR